MKPSISRDDHSLPQEELLHKSGKTISLLNPVDRISETLYSVIMTLTFTCTIKIAGAESARMKMMLYAAIGCNIAWGIIDGVMYILALDAAKRHNLYILGLIRKTKNPDQVREIISHELSSLVGPQLKTDDLEKIRQSLLKVPIQAQNHSTILKDLLPAMGIFLYAVISAFPVIIPFIIIDDTWWALRISNGIAIFMMFCCGWLLGRYEGGSPWLKGFLLSLIGIILVMVALALGG